MPAQLHLRWFAELALLLMVDVVARVVLAVVVEMLVAENDSLEGVKAQQESGLASCQRLNRIVALA
jgi:hypothetical protein